MSCGSTCVPEGPRGLSAYQIWLAEGNTGTEQDFLDSLVGETGPAGVCECEENYTLVYSSNEALQSDLPGLSPLYNTMTNASFTVLETGNYEVLYVSEVIFEVNATVLVNIFINGIAVTNTLRTITGVTGLCIPMSVFKTNIALTAGQIITLKCSSNFPGTAYLRNANLKICKL